MVDFNRGREAHLATPANVLITQDLQIISADRWLAKSQTTFMVQRLLSRFLNKILSQHFPSLVIHRASLSLPYGDKRHWNANFQQS